MKILTRDDTDHNTEYVTLRDAQLEIEAMQTRALAAEKKLLAIEDIAEKIIPGYGNTGKSTFTTPVSVMHRLRDEVNTLRQQIESEHQNSIDWFIGYQELKTALQDIAKTDRLSAWNIAEAALAKAKQAESSITPPPTPS